MPDQKTLDEMFQEFKNEALADIDPAYLTDDVDRWPKVLDEICLVLWTMEYKSPMLGDVTGSDIHLVMFEGNPRFQWNTVCIDNDDPDSEELVGIARFTEIDPYLSGQDNIRRMLHIQACHEIDEQLWIGNERPFYPHNTDREGTQDVLS